jgi:hypothetical protein
VPGEDGQTWENKGRRSIEYLTVNGPVQVSRRVYWNRQQGSITPVDQWLGMSQGRYSVGVRQLCCREAADSDFRTAAENLACVGQLQISHETVRCIVEGEGKQVLKQQRSGTVGPDWTAEDCRSKPQEPTCIITGADGVKVPLVTQAEKDKRKALEHLSKFIAARMEMTQYPQFKAAGYQIGSGPTEAFCKTLTSRLKGQGMRWDKPNAEAMMALASVRSSHLWQSYWDIQCKIPA